MTVNTLRPMGPDILGHGWCQRCDGLFHNRDMVSSVGLCKNCAGKAEDVSIEVEGRVFHLSLRKKRRMGHSVAKIAHREAAKRLIREQRARYDELVAEEKHIAMVEMTVAEARRLTSPLPSAD